MLRHLLALSAFALVASVSAHAAVGDACDPNANPPAPAACDTTDTTKVDVCDPQSSKIVAFDCTTLAAGAACGQDQCTGSGCTGLGDTCVAQDGGACTGFSALTSQATAGNFGAVLCAGTDTCKSAVSGQALADTCVAHEGGDCVAGAADPGSCTGTVLSLCQENATAALASNIEVDCALFQGGGCGIQDCDCDAQCGSDPTTAKCVGGKCEFCDQQGQNCASQTFCTFPKDATKCATAGEGEGEGAGGGEGEGAGQSCTKSSDCPTGDVCDNGTCKRDTGDTGTQPAPSCSDSGTGVGFPLAGLAAIVVVAPMFRRRRAA